MRNIIKNTSERETRRPNRVPLFLNANVALMDIK